MVFRGGQKNLSEEKGQKKKKKERDNQNGSLLYI